MTARRARWAPFTISALFVVALTGFVGCTGSSTPPADDTARVVHLVESTGLVFDRFAYQELRPLEVWTFAADEPWSFDGLEVLERGDGLVARAEAEARLTLPVTLDAAAVEEIVVHLRDNIGRIEVAWAGAGEDWAAERSMTRRAVEAEAGALRFRVRARPAWKGAVERLRFTVRNRQAYSLMLDAVRIGRLEVDSDRLQQTLASTWRVDIRGETRPSLLSAPGTGRRLDVHVPAAGRLEVGLGLSHGVPAPLQARVLVHAAGHDPQVVLDERLEPTPRARADWVDRQVDLSAYAGRSVELELAVDAEPSWRPQHGLVAWGDPTVVAGAASPPRGAPNLILVSVDTLRADHLPLYGYSRPTAPRLSAWAARDAVVFEDAVASAPWTLPSHVSMFTGWGALHHGVNYRRAAPESLTSIAEALRDAGYRTVARTAGAYLHPTFGLGQGFDSFSYCTDCVVGDEMGRFLEQLGEPVDGRQPFFGFFHTYEVHEPYTAREPFFERLTGAPGSDDAYVTAAVPDRGSFEVKHHFVRVEGKATADLSPDEIRAVVDRYDSRVASVDEQLGRLFAWLEETGRSDDTAVVITSDHGESLGEKGLGGHSHLYDELLRVPLVVGLPGGRHGGTRVERQVRSIDIAPTLAALASDGLPEPVSIAAEGRSVLPLIEDPRSEFPAEAWSYVATSNVGVSVRVADRWKYIVRDTAWHTSHGGEQLFDLRADPAEERDLSLSAEADVARFREQAWRHLAEQARGLLLRAVNRSDAPWTLQLRGGGVDPQRVKSWDASCGCVVWQGKLRGARVELAPGAEVPLLLRDLEADQARLELEASLADGTTWSTVVDAVADSVDDAPWLLVGDDGWSSAETLPSGDTSGDTPGGQGAIGVSLEWLGAEPTAREAVLDPELTEQLRALGYIE